MNLAKLLLCVPTVFVTTITPVSSDEPAIALVEDFDQYGDQLPVGAIARLGTARLRTAGSPTGVVFSPDGERLAACSWNAVVPVWDVKTAQPLEPYVTDPAGEVMAVRYSPDGECVVAVGTGGEVWVWDAKTHKTLWSEKAHDGRTYGIAFSPDGQTLATAGGLNGPSIRLWNLGNSQVRKAVNAKTRLLDTIPIEDRITDDFPIDFSPDGKRLAFGTRRKIQVWELDRQLVVTQIDRPFRREVSSLWFVDGGKALLAAGYGIFRVDEPHDGRSSVSRPSIKRFDAETGELNGNLPTPEAEGSNPKVVLLSDGASYLYVGRRGLYICSLDDGMVRKELPLNENFWGLRSGAIALQPNGGAWSAHVRNQQIRLVNLKTDEELHRELRGHAGYVIALAATPTGEKVVTGGSHGRVLEWRASTGEFLRELPSLEGWVRCLEFTPDGQTLLIAGEARDDSGRFVGQIKVFDYESGEELWGREVADRVMAAAIAADGQQFAIAEGLGRASGFADGEPVNQIEVGTVVSGEITNTFKGFQHRPDAVAFTDDGQSVRLLTDDSQLWQWYFDGRPARQPVDLLGKSNKKQSMQRAMDTTGKLAVLTGTDYPPKNLQLDSVRELQRSGWVGLLDVETLEFRWIEEIGFDYGRKSAISPDGQLVATYQVGPQQRGREQSVFIRATDDGKMRWVFPLDNVALYSLKFSPDNRRLIGGTDRGDAIVWDLSMLADLP